MNPQTWEKIVYLAEEKFGLKKKEEEDFVVAESLQGQKIMGKKEIIEFESPQGLMRLEFVIEPKIIGKKVLSSRRIGSRVKEEYIYSQDEYIYKLKSYKFDPETNEWQEIEFDL